jgi:hypothetical protein
MGGARYDPNFWQAVGIQLLCFIFLGLLPVLWIVQILIGLCFMLWTPSEVVETARKLAGAMFTMTLFPFVLTFETAVSSAVGWLVLPVISPTLCLEGPRGPGRPLLF